MTVVCAVGRNSCQGVWPGLPSYTTTCTWLQFLADTCTRTHNTHTHYTHTRILMLDTHTHIHTHMHTHTHTHMLNTHAHTQQTRPRLRVVDPLDYEGELSSRRRDLEKEQYLNLLLFPQQDIVVGLPTCTSGGGGGGGHNVPSGYQHVCLIRHCMVCADPPFPKCIVPSGVSNVSLATCTLW